MYIDQQNTRQIECILTLSSVMILRKSFQDIQHNIIKQSAIHYCQQFTLYLNITHFSTINITSEGGFNASIGICHYVASNNMFFRIWHDRFYEKRRTDRSRERMDAG
jgi:hypothetical protein